MIEKSGARLRYVTSGCVRSGAGELAARLKVLLEGLNEVIAANLPGEVAIEKVFVNVNPPSTLALDPSPDAADALACAICHAHGSRLGAFAVRGLRMKRGRLA